MSEIDILNIHNEIINNFEKESKLIPELLERVKTLSNILKIKSLSPHIIKNIKKEKDCILKNIENIENKTDYYLYINETYQLIEEYKKILNTPVVISFTNKTKKDDIEKRNIIIKFLNMIQKYHPIEYEIPTKKKKLKCNCGNKNFNIIEDNVCVCTNCGEEHKIHLYTSSYKDVDRVNISSKYQYDRIIHFRDCINQYQGKQNCTIEDCVYKDLITQFKNHSLLVGNDTDEINIRCKNITHEHINLFLKELGYTKHYENVNLIHSVLTGIKPDDISYLEDSLMDDFIILTELYDKRFKKEKKIVRKNFINTQYVLYQLLCKYKHPCKREDFNILKTVDRQAFHDEVCQELFNELEWTFTPYL
jgi:hypothetical protein